MKIKNCFLVLIGLAFGFSLVGCSNSSGPILPKDALTAEQLEKIKKEDRAIENEESQGSIKN
jgi:predicted small lipoprotein YifL